MHRSGQDLLFIALLLWHGRQRSALPTLAAGRRGMCTNFLNRVGVNSNSRSQVSCMCPHNEVQLAAVTRWPPALFNLTDSNERSRSTLYMGRRTASGVSPSRLAFRVPSCWPLRDKQPHTQLSMKMKEKIWLLLLLCSCYRSGR